MLESRKDFDVEIIVASLYYNAVFDKKCRELDVKFVALPSESLMAAYKYLDKLSANKLALIWLSLPVHLTYMSQFATNLVLWSHKFHPNIRDISLRLRVNFGVSPIVEINGQNWYDFDIGHNIHNSGIIKNSWARRKNKFGSFCREELIDKIDHWQKTRSCV